MKDIKRVLKFTKYDTYNSIRKVADDIVISLMNNETFNRPRTFTSTIVVNPIYQIGVGLGIFIPKCREYGVEKDERYMLYDIKIYQVLGNRKSRISIAQNEQLRQIVLGNDIVEQEEIIKIEEESDGKL